LSSIIEYPIKLKENAEFIDPLAFSNTPEILFNTLSRIFLCKTLSLYFLKSMNKGCKQSTRGFEATLDSESSVDLMNNSLINNLENVLGIPENLGKGEGEWKGIPRKLWTHTRRVDNMFIKHSWNLTMAIMPQDQWRGRDCQPPGLDVYPGGFSLDESYLYGLLHEDGGSGGIFGVQIDINKKRGRSKSLGSLEWRPFFIFNIPNENYTTDFCPFPYTHTILETIKFYYNISAPIKKTNKNTTLSLILTDMDDLYRVVL